jgi:hypothetical protein
MPKPDYPPDDGAVMKTGFYKASVLTTVIGFSVSMNTTNRLDSGELLANSTRVSTSVYIRILKLVPRLAAVPPMVSPARR